MSSAQAVASAQDVADELYGLPVHRFLAVRDLRAAQARGAGDVAAAVVISRFRRPSVAAWVTNQLARYGHDQVAQLVEIGRQLRLATARSDGAALRDLTTRRRGVEAELLRLGGALAAEGGVRLDQRCLTAVSATLRAALGHEGMAHLVVDGRLVHALTPVSWPGLDDGGPDPLPEDAGDELAQRRAMRLVHRGPRRGPLDDDEDGRERLDRPCAPVTDIFARERRP